MRRIVISVTVTMALGAVSPNAAALSLPDCAGPLEARNVQVVRVEKNADLVLEDGRAVWLEGIVLPQGAKDHAPSFYAEQALGALSDLASSRHVALSTAEPKEDRWGRLRAQVFFSETADEPWLQIAMLRRGLARVSMAPDRGECAKQLYAAEAQARKKHFGIWTSDAYAVRTPSDLAGTLGTFQIVQGNVSEVMVKNGRAYLEFGPDRQAGFKIMIAPDDLRRFRDDGVDPREYTGMTIRARGFVDRSWGLEIEVASPEAIEVVEAP